MTLRTLSHHMRTFNASITICSNWWLPASLQIWAEFKFAAQIYSAVVNDAVVVIILPGFWDHTTLYKGLCRELKPCCWGSRHCPSPFMLRKPEIRTGVMGHQAPTQTFNYSSVASEFKSLVLRLLGASWDCWSVGNLLQYLPSTHTHPPTQYGIVRLCFFLLPGMWQLTD